MRLRKTIICGAVCVLALLGIGTQQTWAQSSSLNAFSPYTFYGIGDINTQGIGVTRAMGGASLGFRSPIYVNVTNPASYSSVRSNSFLSNFDMEGQNFYAHSQTAKTSYNTFNLRDIAMSFPLIKGMGMALSMTPYSSVGYRVQYYDSDPDVQANIGQVLHAYAGDGDVTQFKLGIGYEPFNNFSIGLEAIYYHGEIERSFNAIPTTITGSGNYQTLSGNSTEMINRFYGKVGVQWTPIAKTSTVLTIGATYQMGGAMGIEVEETVPLNGILTPDLNVVDREYVSDFAMPNIVGVGVFLHKYKYSIGADYEFADWGNLNRNYGSENMAFRNTSTVRLGGQYTPNPGDVRNALNRWTYRAGVRLSQSYLVLNGQNINDMALTFGVGVPLRMTGLSNVNLGLELGQRGTTAAGLTKENYLKFTIGFSFLGEDYWFMKVKYD